MCRLGRVLDGRSRGTGFGPRDRVAGSKRAGSRRTGARCEIETILGSLTFAAPVGRISDWRLRRHLMIDARR